MWGQKPPKPDLYLKPSAETVSYLKASWLNKTSLSKYFVSTACFVLNTHRDRRSLMSSRNNSEVSFLFFLLRGLTPAMSSSTEQPLCFHFYHETPMDSKQSTDSPAIASSLTTKVLNHFSPVSLSASLPYEYALAVSQSPFNCSYSYWTCSV